MKKAYWIIAGIILLCLSIFYFTRSSANAEDDKPVTTEVSQGDFEVSVKATGELRAKNSVKIRGPKRMREADIWQTTITRIAPEGTALKKGDWVASLDKSGVEGKLSDARGEIEKIETQLEQAKIDTTIELSGMRDQLSDLKFDMKEKELLVQQSQFEAKMVIQQAELNLERIRRDYAQLINNYELKQQQKIAKIAEINASLRQQKRKYRLLESIGEEFDIKAPEDGMLIYLSGWNGDKKGEGGQVSAWNPLVGELPDLSSMVSVTYVNEVDISKIRVGQEVTVGIDAFPDKSFEGTVKSVANVGQQLRNQDAKVFEMIVELTSSDSTLRPAMTTSNEVSVRAISEAIYIPLEALNQDSMTYVIMNRNNKPIKQEIVIGHVNENNVTVELGLEAGQEIYLHYIGDREELDFNALTHVDKQTAKNKFEKSNASYEKAMANKSKETKPFDGKMESGGQGTTIIFN